MSDNFVTLIGNLTRDPELRYTSGATAVCDFGIAHSKRFYDQKKGEWAEGDTSFFNITAWRELGEHCAESFRKGQRVIVICEAKQETWEDQDGNKRSAVRFVAQDVGPSLKWGTAVFEKAERSGGNGHSAERQTTPNQPDPGPVYGDEEPF